jgi:hypothetical protein
MGIEDFQHRDEALRRITHEPREKFIVGIDLGCSVDPTAICVMHFRKIPLDTWKVRREENRNSWNITEQEIETRYGVVHLERMGLGVAYPVQVQDIKHLLGRDPLRHAKPDLIVDASFDHLGSGGYESRQPPLAHCEVCFDLRLGRRLAYRRTKVRTGAPRGSGDDFDRHVAAAGRATYAARTGLHDDLVLSCALCVWRARGGGPGEVHCGTLTGLTECRYFVPGLPRSRRTSPKPACSLTTSVFGWLRP